MKNKTINCQKSSKIQRNKNYQAVRKVPTSRKTKTTIRKSRKTKTTKMSEKFQNLEKQKIPNCQKSSKIQKNKNYQTVRKVPKSKNKIPKLAEQFQILIEKSQKEARSIAHFIGLVQPSDIAGKSGLL